MLLNCYAPVSPRHKQPRKAKNCFLVTQNSALGTLDYMWLAYIMDVNELMDAATCLAQGLCPYQPLPAVNSRKSHVFVNKMFGKVQGFYAKIMG